MSEKQYFSLKTDVYSFMLAHWDKLCLNKKSISFPLPSLHSLPLFPSFSFSFYLYLYLFFLPHVQKVITGINRYKTCSLTPRICLNQEWTSTSKMVCYSFDLFFSLFLSPLFFSLCFSLCFSLFTKRSHRNNILSLATFYCFLFWAYIVSLVFSDSAVSQNRFIFLSLSIIYLLSPTHFTINLPSAEVLSLVIHLSLIDLLLHFILSSTIFCTMLLYS